VRVIAVRETWIATVVRTWRDGSPISGSGLVGPAVVDRDARPVAVTVCPG
jgi:hypothetical protein